MARDGTGLTAARLRHPVSSYSELLAQQRAEVSDSLFGAVRRLSWSRERLAAERERRLRELLAWTAPRSPFHRERLAAIDITAAREADLAAVPPMTKHDLMENFDRIVTDPALTMTLANAHLDRLEDDAYLLDRYRTIATSGTSGRRGVFVYGWDDWVTFAVLTTRWNIRRSDSPGSADGVTASLFAKRASHVSGALHAFFADPSQPLCHLPITMPLARIVSGLNAAQPKHIGGYPSAIQLIAGEARAGRLRIAPKEINTCGELLTDDVRAAAREVWGVEISDMWGLSEGIYAVSCDVEPGMHLPDDLVIVEPVDRWGRPVPAGAPAEKVYITNLYNRTLPLVRYEVADAMTLVDEPCACGSGHRRIDKLKGRLDDTLRYPGGAAVHPSGFCAALMRHPEVTDYQIRQTPTGVSVLVRTTGPGRCAVDRLRADVVATMAEAGVPNPEATIIEVDSFDRLWSGKLRRIVPMEESAVN